MEYRDGGRVFINGVLAYTNPTGNHWWDGIKLYHKCCEDAGDELWVDGVLVYREGGNDKEGDAGPTATDTAVRIVQRALYEMRAINRVQRTGRLLVAGLVLCGALYLSTTFNHWLFYIYFLVVSLFFLVLLRASLVYLVHWPNDTSFPTQRRKFTPLLFILLYGLLASRPLKEEKVRDYIECMVSQEPDIDTDIALSSWRRSVARSLRVVAL